MNVNSAGLQVVQTQLNSASLVKGKCIPLRLDFTSVGTWTVDLSMSEWQRFISRIQTVYVDASASTVPVFVVVRGTGQTIKAAAGSQGYYPVLASNPTVFDISCASGVIPVFLIEAYLDAYVWGNSAAAGSSITMGPYASLPASGSAGAMYLCTDSPYEFFWTGSIWQARYRGANVTPPPLSATWTQINPGGKLTTSDWNGMIDLKVADTSGTANWRMIGLPVPAAPYHVEFLFKSITFIGASGGNGTGAYFYSSVSTKMAGIERLGGQFRVEHMNTPSSDSGTAASFPNGTGGTPTLTQWADLWFRLGNNGVNLTYDYAFERGDWVNLWTEAVGSWVTPTHYCLGGVSVVGSASSFVAMQIGHVGITG